MNIAVSVWRLFSNCFICYVALNFILYCTKLNGKKFIPVWLILSCALTVFFSEFNIAGGLAFETFALAVFVWTIFRTPVKKLLPPTFVVVAWCAYTELASAILASFTFDKWNPFFADTFISFLCDISFLFSLLLIKKYFIPILRCEAAPYWFSLLLPGTIFTLFLSNSINSNKPSFIKYLFPSELNVYIISTAFLVISVLFAFVLMTVFSKTLKISEKHTSEALLKNQLASQKIYISEAMKRNRQNNMIRNNVELHLARLSNMLSDGSYEEAENYLSKLQPGNASMSAPLYTGSLALDVLLNEKLSHAARSRIKTACSVHIPINLRINDMDLCVIFSNIMDNASAACMNVKRKKRFLRISTASKGDLLLIEAVNSSAVYGPLKPGTGLSSVCSLANKYHGYVETESCEGVFRISILLCSPKAQEDIGTAPPQNSVYGTP